RLHHDRAAALCALTRATGGAETTEATFAALSHALAELLHLLGCRPLPAVESAAAAGGATALRHALADLLHLLRRRRLATVEPAPRRTTGRTGIPSRAGTCIRGAGHHAAGGGNWGTGRGTGGASGLLRAARGTVLCIATGHLTRDLLALLQRGH